MLGRPLAFAPKYKMTVQIEFPEPLEILKFEAELGQPLEIREDERLVAIIKIIGLYTDEASNS